MFFMSYPEFLAIFIGVVQGKSCTILSEIKMSGSLLDEFLYVDLMG